MARFSFDIKKFLPFRNVFGKEDLKLYGEGAILGLENYPASTLYDSTNQNNPYGYNKLSQKMPIMLGLDIPTFRVLDVLALETEWYGCPYPDGYMEIVRNGLPIPDQYTNYQNTPWKWSVYAKKEVAAGFSLVAQCARDHTRLTTELAKNVDYDETLVGNNQWWWMAKVLYTF